jgi:hypothetical protein
MSYNSEVYMSKLTYENNAGEKTVVELSELQITDLEVELDVNMLEPLWEQLKAKVQAKQPVVEETVL